jgi:hypothetical protein
MNQILRNFLVGYGGANHTGAEIRILTIIDDVRAVFGDRVHTTVGTVDKEKTLRILSESETPRVVQFSSLHALIRSTPLRAKQRLLFLGYGRGFLRRGRLAEVAA